jgi:hypothetical protein
MNERKAAEEEAGQKANPNPVSAGPCPDWVSGNVPLTPLPPPGWPPQWHTMSHNLNSMNLLVDAKLGAPTARAR